MTLHPGQELFTHQSGGGVELLAQVYAPVSLLVCHLHVSQEPSRHGCQGILGPGLNKHVMIMLPFFKTPGKLQETFKWEESLIPVELL